MTTLIPKYDLMNGGSTPTGAINRPINNKLADTLSVKDFGAVGDGTTDDTNAFLAAVAAVQNNRTLYGGGTLHIPTGHYIIKQTLVFTQGAHSGSASGHNVFITGDGGWNTMLDFTNAPSGSFGIHFNEGGNFGVSNLSITGTPAAGIYLGSYPVTEVYCSNYIFENLIIGSCGTHSIESAFSYLGTIKDCFFASNGVHGVSFSGYHTSLIFDKVTCTVNAADGFYLNGATYSNFISCAADANNANAYALQNCTGVVFNGCGCEANGQAGWYLSTNNTASTIKDIHGVVLNGCCGFFNSASSVGAYATFVGAFTNNNSPIELTINGGTCLQSVAGNVGIQLIGNSGAINYSSNNFFNNGMTTPITISGVVNQTNVSNGSLISDVDFSVVSSTYNKENYSGSSNTYFANYSINGVLKGNISYNGTNIVYATTSDYRLKDNIAPMVNALNKIEKLNPVTYTWKDSGKTGEGFIADELQSIFPEAVVGEKDAVDYKGNPVYQTIDTSIIVATLTSAIKELKAEVDALKAK